MAGTVAGSQSVFGTNEVRLIWPLPAVVIGMLMVNEVALGMPVTTAPAGIPVPLTGMPTIRVLVLGVTAVMVVEPAVRVPVTAVVVVPRHCAYDDMGMHHMPATNRKGSAMTDNRLLARMGAPCRSGVKCMIMRV